MKMTKRTTTKETPPRRLARAPPALSLTACPPCRSQLWLPPPTLLLTRPTSRRRMSWVTPTSRRCLATSPPCRASRSRRRLCPATQRGGSGVRPSTSEACRGCWAAGCWFLPPPPWMKTSPSPLQTSPPLHPACPLPGWTTLDAHPPSPLHPHLQPAVTSPHDATSHPVPDICRPGETSLLSVTSPQRETWVQLAGIGGTSPQGGGTSHCSPLSRDPRLLQEETTSVTCHREAAGR